MRLAVISSDESCFWLRRDSSMLEFMVAAVSRSLSLAPVAWPLVVLASFEEPRDFPLCVGDFVRRDRVPIGMGWAVSLVSLVPCSCWPGGHCSGGPCGGIGRGLLSMLFGSSK